MIDLHYAPTPNGWKISIMLEELALPYAVHRIDIGKGDSTRPSTGASTPTKIPAIVDPRRRRRRAITVFESGAILIYLAEKTGRLLAGAGPERYAALEWVMWQMGGLGPMLGQYFHFTRYAPEKIPYAVERYRNESRRAAGRARRPFGVPRLLPD